MTFWNGKEIPIPGDAGFLGSHIIDKPHRIGVPNVHIIISRNRMLNLGRWDNCEKVVVGKDIVIHLAVKVGGSYKTGCTAAPVSSDVSGIGEEVVYD